MCAAWKTLGKASISAVSTLDDKKRFKSDPTSDLHVVTKLHEVLSSADVIVAHNGDQYDIKFTEGRMLYHGLKPLPPIYKIDTLKEARNRFLLNSNKLDYLGAYLKVGRKRPTKTGLWLRVLKNDATAIRDMVRYNKQDVALLERVFLKLAPYMTSHVNRQLFGGTGCPRCGSTKVQSRGEHRSVTQVYHRWQCQTCGGWFREAKRTRGAVSRLL